VSSEHDAAMEGGKHKRGLRKKETQATTLKVEELQRQLQEKKEQWEREQAKLLRAIKEAEEEKPKEPKKKPQKPPSQKKHKRGTEEVVKEEKEEKEEKEGGTEEKPVPLLRPINPPNYKLWPPSEFQKEAPFRTNYKERRKKALAVYAKREKEILAEFPKGCSVIINCNTGDILGCGEDNNIAYQDYCRGKVHTETFPLVVGAPESVEEVFIGAVATQHWNNPTNNPTFPGLVIANPDTGATLPAPCGVTLADTGAQRSLVRGAHIVALGLKKSAKNRYNGTLLKSYFITLSYLGETVIASVAKLDDLLPQRNDDALVGMDFIRLYKLTLDRGKSLRIESFPPLQTSCSCDKTQCVNKRCSCKKAGNLCLPGVRCSCNNCKNDGN